MKVRVAVTGDLAAIADIYNQAVAEQATADTEPVSIDDRRAWLARHPAESRPVLVAEEDGAVVGWASLSDYREGRGAVRRTAEISYYVDTAHRRKGVASRLVREAILQAPRLGIRTLFAILLDDNEASVRLLGRLSFERWGHLPGVADFGGKQAGHLYYGLRVD